MTTMTTPSSNLSVVYNATLTTTVTVVLSSGDAAYWPLWVNIIVPIVVIVLFFITVALTLFYGQSKLKHIASPLPIIVTHNDAPNTHNNDAIISAMSIGQKSNVSEGSDTSKKSEAQDVVAETNLFQKAKEQALKTRAGRRLSSLRSRVSNSSYDYSPLESGEAGVDNQIQDTSDDESQCGDAQNIVTVDVEHHSPPPRNVLIHSEDSGFTESASANQSTRTSSSDINIV